MIEISGDGPVDYYAFEEPELFEWINNRVDAPPPALAELAKQRDPGYFASMVAQGNGTEEGERFSNAVCGYLTSGSYHSDKLHAVAAAVGPVASGSAQFAAWVASSGAEIIESLNTIYY